LKRTPDVQQLFVNAGGTKNFSQHLARGPCTPGLTKVQARQLPSPSHAALQTFGFAKARSKFLKSPPGRSMAGSNVRMGTPLVQQPLNLAAGMTFLSQHLASGP